MVAQVFWAVYYFSRQPRQIGPTADFDGATIPPPIFSMFEPPCTSGSDGPAKYVDDELKDKD